MMHKNQDIERLIIQLNDALCTWERTTAIESVLIIRSIDGYVHRSVGGKPGVPDDISDVELINNIIGEDEPRDSDDNKKRCPLEGVKSVASFISYIYH